MRAWRGWSNMPSAICAGLAKMLFLQCGLPQTECWLSLVPGVAPRFNCRVDACEAVVLPGRYVAVRALAGRSASVPRPDDFRTAGQ